MKLNVRCTAPVIVLPVSGRARNALAAHLDQLTLDNCFKYAGDEGTLSAPAEGRRPLLDVRSVRLAGVALWCARGGRGLRVRRRGAPLLHAPADLRLHIEYNMDAAHTGRSRSDPVSPVCPAVLMLPPPAPQCRTCRCRAR